MRLDFSVAVATYSRVYNLNSLMLKIIMLERRSYCRERSDRPTQMKPYPVENPAVFLNEFEKVTSTLSLVLQKPFFLFSN